MTTLASGIEIVGDLGDWNNRSLGLVQESIALVGMQSRPQQTEPSSGFYFGEIDHNHGKDIPEVIEWKYDGQEVTARTFPAANWLLRLDQFSPVEDRLLAGTSLKAYTMAQLCVALSKTKDMIGVLV